MRDIVGIYWFVGAMALFFIGTSAMVFVMGKRAYLPTGSSQH